MTRRTTPFRNPAVKAKFDAYPRHARSRLLALRELLFQTAAVTDGVGAIDGTLKWGEPAYVTRNKSGSTTRALTYHLDAQVDGNNRRNS